MTWDKGAAVSDRNKCSFHAQEKLNRVVFPAIDGE
jgi:hypothetical protein